jgi:hypothetical protein
MTFARRLIAKDSLSFPQASKASCHRTVGWRRKHAKTKGDFESARRKEGGSGLAWLLGDLWLPSVPKLPSSGACSQLPESKYERAPGCAFFTPGHYQGHLGMLYFLTESSVKASCPSRFRIPGTANDQHQCRNRVGFGFRSSSTRVVDSHQDGCADQASALYSRA